MIFKILILCLISNLVYMKPSSSDSYKFSDGSSQGDSSSIDSSRKDFSSISKNSKSSDSKSWDSSNSRKSRL
jgi:hypothetical protein